MKLLQEMAQRSLYMDQVVILDDTLESLDDNKYQVKGVYESRANKEAVLKITFLHSPPEPVNRGIDSFNIEPTNNFDYVEIQQILDEEGNDVTETFNTGNLEADLMYLMMNNQEDINPRSLGLGNVYEM